MSMFTFPHCLRQNTYFRYLIVSAGALGVDITVFLGIMTMGAAAAPAAALGYSAGIVAHWLATSRLVFMGKVAPCGSRRTRQKAQFVASALIGLGLTTAIVWSCNRSEMDPRVAKLIAVGASFQATWLLRNLVIFRSTYDIA